jgi:hypothetical protein
MKNEGSVVEMNETEGIPAILAILVIGNLIYGTGVVY